MNDSHSREIEDSHVAWYDEEIGEWIAAFGDFKGHGKSKEQAFNNLMMDIEFYDNGFEICENDERNTDEDE